MEASCGIGLLGQGVAKRGAQRWLWRLRLGWYHWEQRRNFGSIRFFQKEKIRQRGEGKGWGGEREGTPGNKSASPANPSGSSVANGPS